ncbi:glycosyltransferase family 2 protein [Dyadobacter chenhuakuii]|uniref:Glycosyltransferase family 2 protein n=1 Tax=Dyadobacter chenhuakuii TaxID=2909339 RepID=A0ABY4XJG4_9BACT|nr:glycosyltransferase family 2 protein [Dyadobacter chenhuakuii]MCF2496285.1 glycosyltransferase family 2 protein [Dyadobacter chenhuakuii]USJ30345.1 glycosyltransferase family 2 protein [Dyadobacter chenhuakuii]
MKISGFTIIRNAIINDYPIVEAITSILPVVDEMLVSVGHSDDDTLGLIRSIASDKIRIVESEWDMSLREGGKVLAVETDKALKQISPDADWAFYIQGDEAVHEKYHQAIIDSCTRHLTDERVEGLVFDYVHFYGTYDYIGDSRKWYRREIRIIRNEKSPKGLPISAYRDAQGFRRGNQKLNVMHSGAAVYHYGWVKSPAQMKTKMKNVSRFWNEGEAWEKILESDDVFNYEEFDSLKRFEETHPTVMQERIARQNWKVDLDTSKKRFKLKDALLYWYEKGTGKRLFEFRNYRLL